MKKIQKSHLFFASFLVVLFLMVMALWAFGKMKLIEYVDSLHTIQQKSAEIQSENQGVGEKTSLNSKGQSNNNGSDLTNGPRLSAPIDNAVERVTKKPFGIYIAPQTSPIQPERFLGYHTGTDFEIFDGEQDDDVIIKAICSGSVLEKKYVSGYGGVLVQSCNIDNQPVAVLYGHLKLDSIGPNKGDSIGSGQKIAVLGQGNSQETDFERKHLHLAIHKGRGINYRGYVSAEKELSDWLDPMGDISNK